MKTYADLLKEQMQAAGVTLSTATPAKPSEQVRETIISAEGCSAIPGEPELAALRLEFIDSIFTLQGKRRTPIRCAAEDLRYVLLEGPSRIEDCAA